MKHLITALSIAVALATGLLLGALLAPGIAQSQANIVTTDSSPASIQAQLSTSNTIVATDGHGNVCRGLYVKVSGDVVVTDGYGTQVTYASVAANTLLPFKPRFLNTATTATVICWAGF